MTEREARLENANSELEGYINDIDETVKTISFYKNRLEDVAEDIRKMIMNNIKNMDECKNEYPFLVCGLNGTKINSEIKRLLNSLSYQASVSAKKF